MSIFRTERDKEEFVRIFRKITMSGVVSGDVAIEKIIRDNPHFFHQPTADELKKSFHSVLNDELRSRAQQTNRLSIDIFRGLADKQKPS